MEGTSPASKAAPLVRRGFEFSRLEGELLALAYEHLLPIIRSPAARRPLALHAASHGGQPSFQEEQDCEAR